MSVHRKALVVCHGYFGDHLYASSIAKKLIEEDQFDQVDYLVGWPQIIDLLKLNPYITNIFYKGTTATPTLSSLELHEYSSTNGTFDAIIQLNSLSFVEPPCVEFQKVAGVKTPSPEFTVYTDPKIDAEVAEHFNAIREEVGSTPIVAIMDNWEPKTYLFTKEQYARGIDVPNKGYGGRWRNTTHIINKLQERFVTLTVGAPSGVSQFDTVRPFGSIRSLLDEASVLKHCDFFVGAEGGMANLAAGVGCKTILTSDFVHQLYGWNGVIRKIPEPKLGPRFYFSTGHIDLDPYLTDEEVAEQMITIIERSCTHE